MRIRASHVGIVAWTLAILAALFVLSCRSCPTCPRLPIVTPLPEIKVTTTRAACLAARPPEPPHFAPLPPNDARCAAPLTACFERESAAALRLYLDTLETWAATAWSRCGETPTTEEGQ